MPELPEIHRFAALIMQHRSVEFLAPFIPDSVVSNRRPAIEDAEKFSPCIVTAMPKGLLLIFLLKLN